MEERGLVAEEESAAERGAVVAAEAVAGMRKTVRTERSGKSVIPTKTGMGSPSQSPSFTRNARHATSRRKTDA